MSLDPNPPRGPADTDPVEVTAVVLPADRDGPSDLPPALVLCALCDAVGDGIAPPGWAVASPSGAEGAVAMFGVCPNCIAIGGAVLPPGYVRLPG